MADFTQIKRNEHLPVRIAAEISREIADGSIRPGQKLPTEHILASSFGVSRSVVREAIAQLRNEGLVETRQGVGAFATEIQQRQSIRFEVAHHGDQAAFCSLFQVRFALETEAAGLAALHRSEADLARLDDALAQMTGADKWTDQGIVADLAFHKTVAAATHNDYFLQFVGFIAEKTHIAINAARASAILEEIVEITIAEHVAVRDAIEGGNPMAAKTAMRHHLEGAAKRLSLELEM
ncbi:FadR/GntR family transcriptional regulator [Neorhizobium sp. NPDC001467]|uniref:FadR/GntR family transcriptional regulator n=1 Tax=Neorhizobium sp. NPDC001467 TaxID=3390595 RepID=UPI003CFF5AA8